MGKLEIEIENKHAHNYRDWIKRKVQTPERSYVVVDSAGGRAYTLREFAKITMQEHAEIKKRLNESFKDFTCEQTNIPVDDPRLYCRSNMRRIYICKDKVINGRVPPSDVLFVIHCGTSCTDAVSVCADSTWKISVTEIPVSSQN